MEPWVKMHRQPQLIHAVQEMLWQEYYYFQDSKFTLALIQELYDLTPVSSLQAKAE
jgi:hypothetical protein